MVNSNEVLLDNKIKQYQFVGKSNEKNSKAETEPSLEMLK